MWGQRDRYKRESFPPALTVQSGKKSLHFRWKLIFKVKLPDTKSLV